MRTELRYPSITALSEREQIVQIKNYLIQLVNQLQVFIDDSDVHLKQTNQKNGSALMTLETAKAFETVKPFIIRSEEIIATYYKEIGERLKNSYLEGEKWNKLELSEFVSSSDFSIGQAGNGGCYYKSGTAEKHIFIAFNCSFVYNGSPIKINKLQIPANYRPQNDVYALCAVNGRAVAQIVINKDGEVFAEWVQAFSAASETTAYTVDWVDGYIDYWI